MRADEAHAANPGLHAGVKLLKNLRVDLQLDAKHQFGPFVRSFHRLRSELRVGRDEADFRRNDVIRDRIEDDPSLVADTSICRRRGGQEDVI